MKNALVVVVAALASVSCFADRITLSNGSEIHGIVEVEERSDWPPPGTLVRVGMRMRMGGMAWFRGEDVAGIDRGDREEWQVVRERSDEAGDDADAHMDLALWCERRGISR